MSTPKLLYDRRVSPVFLSALATGPLRFIVDFVQSDRLARDLQLRADPKSRKQWATVYIGLTKVLDVFCDGRKAWVYAHETHRVAGGMDPSWLSPRPLSDYNAIKSAIESYLVRATAAVHVRHTGREGAVQSALSSAARPFWLADRESEIHFPDEASRVGLLHDLAAPIYQAFGATGRQDPWWPGVRDRGKWPTFGTGADALAADRSGRLLVIEVKDAGNVKGIVWGPAQARMYAELFARWATQNAPETQSVLRGLVQQRAALGLAARDAPPLADPLQVVPVLAVGAGKVSPKLAERLHATASVMAKVPRGSGVAELEVWRLDVTGGSTKVSAKELV